MLTTEGQSELGEATVARGCGWLTKEEGHATDDRPSGIEVPMMGAQELPLPDHSIDLNLHAPRGARSAQGLRVRGVRPPLTPPPSKWVTGGAPAPGGVVR